MEESNNKIIHPNTNTILKEIINPTTDTLLLEIEKYLKSLISNFKLYQSSSLG